MSTLIVGGGPAGLTAACFSSPPVFVLERMSQPARKLLATGGGRCNLTHAADPERIAAAFGRQARFTQPALRAFPPDAIRAFFRGLGVETRAEPDGCVFPVSQRAADVAEALLRAARANGAELRCGVRVTRLLLTPAGARAEGPARVMGVETADGAIRADRVILAAGGRSYPELGSDGSGFDLARDAGLTLTPPVPALAGLILRETWPRALAGVLCEQAGLWLDEPGGARRSLSGPLLFTHKGISGPPVLDLSGEIAARLLQHDGPVPLRVSFRHDRPAEAWRARFEAWRTRSGARALHNLLSGELPRSLAETLCRITGAHGVAAARAGRGTLTALAGACANQPLHASDTESWGRAMVTRGGVAISELESATLACRRIRGLACAGEIVDVDGRCGGFNLSWAFASGRLAACAAQ
ncbi:MAG: aminoacetone oxidase family FAD-binding enzyme [Kiritimatiellia bacterium]|jgi:predicted Rossmann fold flavoprotein|nr:aminoacetone oxidase family FAD-binding enzyme [Kiritimatiellia bacterium]